MNSPDPGLQAERTALAWSRTALAVLANALLIARAGMASQRTELLVFGLLLLCAAGATQAFSAWRRVVLNQASGAARAPAAALLSLALLAAAGSVAAIGAILLEREVSAQAADRKHVEGERIL